MDIQESKLLKKTTLTDKFRAMLKKAIGYKEGKKFILETKPILKKYTDIELIKLANIEEKLSKAIDENNYNHTLSKGITKDEAESLLGWIVQNAREALIRENKEPFEDAGLLGFCGLGQGITTITLQNMGLSPNILNTNPTLSRNTGRHAFVTVEIPVIGEDNHIKNEPYLIDTTYRQFFVRDDVTTSCGEFIKDKKFGNKVAPLAGYWALKLPNGKHFSETLLSKGYIELTEENAKIYGDSFTLEETKRKNYTKVPNKKELKTRIPGKTYLQNMLNPIRQERIDFYDGELEERNINVKTPRMQKIELNSKFPKQRRLLC